MTLVGYLTWCDLTGHQLVEQKVSSVFIMGGVYPATDIFSEFNFNCGEFLLGDLAECEGSAKAAVENMPATVKMVFSGFEAELDTPDCRSYLRFKAH